MQLTTTEITDRKRKHHTKKAEREYIQHQINAYRYSMSENMRHARTLRDAGYPEEASWFVENARRDSRLAVRSSQYLAHVQGNTR